LLLRSLVDSDDNSMDGVYVNGVLDENQRFIDPFFGSLEFFKGKLSPSGASENFLLFNMNNRYYVIDQDNLNSLIGESHTGSITPFFALEQGAQGVTKYDNIISDTATLVIKAMISDNSMTADTALQNFIKEVQNKAPDITVK